MRRSSAKNLSLIFLAVLLLALAACGGGGSSSSGTPSTIVLSPTTAALAQGATFQITATVEDSGGNALSKFTPAFAVASGGNLVSVSVNGLVCGGQWDSLTTPVNCTRATQSGKATINVSVGTVTSTVIVDVLPPIDNLTVTADPVAPDAAGLDCISQAAAATTPPTTRTYTAKASFKGVDVPLSGVTDAITWTIASSVGTITANTNTTTAVVTAKIPGKTQVTAGFFSSPGTPFLQSTPADFTTCPVSLIQIADSTSATVSPSPLSPAGTVTLTPTLKDSRNSTVSLTDAANANATLFSLLWNSSQPSVASAGSTGIVTANSSTGNSSIIASCTPPNCNSGLGAVYSNVYITKVSGTTTTRTVYVGSATPVVANVTPTAGLTLYPITVGTNATDNTVGTAITLGDVPNSMLFNASGASLYIGTNSGLIILTTATNTVTSVATVIPGKVLAVSPDGGVVLISNPSKSQVFAYSTSAGTFQTLNVSGAIAAAFSPDNSKAYILGNNTLSVYSGGSITSSVPITGAQSASFLASGSLGYIAASGSGLGSKATCNDFDYSVIATSGTPTLVSTLVGSPDGLSVVQNIVAVAAPNLNLVNVTSDNKGFTDAAHKCAPAPVITTQPAFALNGGTTFTPKQLLVTPDGSRAYVLSDVAKLLGVSINGTTLSDAPVTLTNGAVPTTGGATLDSTTVFVGGSDGNVHRVSVSVTPASDTVISLPTTKPTGFTPDFVAVQPR